MSRNTGKRRARSRPSTHPTGHPLADKPMIREPGDMKHFHCPKCRKRWRSTVPTQQCPYCRHVGNFDVLTT